ncbi:MBL fold metallo-hydrolase [Brumicola pallidula]|uniref:Metallo-beta-lactamase family protein n=1 Tax=Brumicola pallidula DSM 14239 = ACAM 615 TaxID=1121922 RepID=K6ZMH7_9ALTE|nr:MBL fold metallo-hydrolase [Glaciecola pallidula]GAC30083.1 metallo-beta-lactamase family protein [Glaciecola pallidula DSM 14239 = ACAM 615]
MLTTFIDVPIPEPGTVQKVAPDIFWLRMPLPFDLDHINLYLVEDGNDGYALIDTGIGTSRVEELWDVLLAKLEKPISKVIVTHMHPDHIGMAGYLVEKFRVPLYMSHSEYFVARAISAGGRGASHWQDDEYLVRCGMSAEYVEKTKQNRKENKGVGQVIRPIPLQYECLREGDSISIGDDQWRVMIGRGHSPEHVCLYSDKRGILISGDHVLPGISPNIGVYSTEPNANSLDLYLTTLPQFLTLPANTLVLPSHKQPFHGLHTRVNELIEHHHAHLRRLREFCQQEKTINDCLPVLFKRKLNPHNMFFAVAEAFAHLNYLYFAGEFSREINAQGQLIFKAETKL